MPVERIGDTARPPAGAWTPAVHTLLRHLDVGFDGAPRVLGIRRAGPEGYAEQVVAAMAGLPRRLHEPPATFTPPPGAVWRHEVDDTPALRIGHNDIGPPNTVFAGGLSYGFIAWEHSGTPFIAGYGATRHEVPGWLTSRSGGSATIPRVLSLSALG